jgi:hypothetical protein
LAWDAGALVSTREYITQGGRHLFPLHAWDVSLEASPDQVAVNNLTADPIAVRHLSSFKRRAAATERV